MQVLWERLTYYLQNNLGYFCLTEIGPIVKKENELHLFYFILDNMGGGVGRGNCTNTLLFFIYLFIYFFFILFLIIIIIIIILSNIVILLLSLLFIIVMLLSCLLYF